MNALIYIHIDRDDKKVSHFRGLPREFLFCFVRVIMISSERNSEGKYCQISYHVVLCNVQVYIRA